MVYAGVDFLRDQGVHLANLRLRDFRNYQRLDAEFTPGFHLLLGQNAQGKTNLLEAVYLLATLRSFRGVGGAQLVRHEAAGYFVGARVVGRQTSEIKVYWSAKKRSVAVDQQPVRRLSDYIGTLRAVVFCTEDMQLVKGTSRVRRRFLDLLLSQTHVEYWPTLQRYMHALRSRNALLKNPHADPRTLESFTAMLMEAGTPLWQMRRDFVPRFEPLVREAYRRIAVEPEEVRLCYRPGVKQDFAVELVQTRSREAVYRSTLIGPHRDDLDLLVNDRDAAQFASEGQKRTLAIALKMAQVEYFSTTHGQPPVLLIDDVMGELDARRRGGLLPLLKRTHQAQGQVFMTCTEENWPHELGRDLIRWTVENGHLQPV
jgi:DNA replication and repair protein RecF